MNQTIYQNNKTLTKYYGKLVEIFRKLDHRDKVVMKDLDYVISYIKSIETLRIHILMDILIMILIKFVKNTKKEVTPNLEEYYVLILREIT